MSGKIEQTYLAAAKNEAQRQLFHRVRQAPDVQKYGGLENGRNKFSGQHTTGAEK